MHILITNDDGIHAPGLAALVEVATRFGEVSVVAPDDHRSGCSHAATTDVPLRAIEHGPRRWAVTGTPVDCVRLGLLHLAPQAEIVLSGINDGGNLGVDLLMSGTVAGVREALLLGRPGIALSQYHQRGQPKDWPRSGRFAAAALDFVWEQPAGPHGYWNINLPDVAADQMPSIVVCEPDPHPLPVRFEPADGAWHYRSDYHSRARCADSDVEVCFGGRIAASRITHDLTRLLG